MTPFAELQLRRPQQLLFEFPVYPQRRPCAPPCAGFAPVAAGGDRGAARCRPRRHHADTRCPPGHRHRLLQYDLPGTRIGINSDLIGYSESTIAQQLAAIRAGGVSWVREDFPWDRIEPSPGVWNWSLPDTLMTAAAQNGFSVLAPFDYSAPWASSDPTGGGNQYYPLKEFADYATFARAVTARYGPGGTFWAANPQLPRVPLGAEELGNEPWFYDFVKPGADSAAYASLAVIDAQAIHTQPRR
jgi:hypothetical protein